MPITKDLKPDEFEITFDCVVADCPVQTTYVWSNEAKKMQKSIRKEANRRIKLAHEEGRHNAKA